MALGGFGGVPFELGGSDGIHESEHLALLDDLAPGWDISEGTAVWNECYAHARAATLIWAVNERLKNEALPLRMLSNLETWEEATGLRVNDDDSDFERRARLAAKLRGLIGNTLADIQDACRAVFGANFTAIVMATDHICYWPGGPEIPGEESAPGPPGFEWSSSRMALAVQVAKAGIGQDVFFAKSASLYAVLEDMLPAWMTIQIGTGSEFTVNVSIVGEAFI